MMFFVWLIGAMAFVVYVALRLLAIGILITLAAALYLLSWIADWTGATYARLRSREPAADPSRSGDQLRSLSTVMVNIAGQLTQ